MDARGVVKRRLRQHGFDIAVPAQAGNVHRTRLARFRLPAPVAATLHHPGRDAMLVPLDRMVNRTGFGYGTQGWHPYVAALQEHLSGVERPYQESLLARFYDRFQPRTVQALLLGDVVDCPGVLANWPAVDALIDIWTASASRVAAVRRHVSVDGDLPHSQYRGPVAPEVGAMHLHRVVRVYRHIAANGYRPLEFPAGHVTGHFVTDGEDYRFVVGHGNHRVAAATVLGYRDIPVTLRALHPPVVSRQALQRWTTSRGGLLEPGEAAAVLDHFLQSNGRSMAATVGLLKEPR